MTRTINKLIASLLVFTMLATIPGLLEARVSSANLPKKGMSKKGVFALGALTGAGAIIAAPYIATAVGAAGAGAAVGGAAAGIGGVVAGAGALIGGVGATIWGAVTAASGFVLGALGSVGMAIGGALSGIAGFIGGLVCSPIFIPALVVIGIAAVAIWLYKRHKRQNPNLGNGSGLGDLPTTGGVTVGTVPDMGSVTPPSSDIGSTGSVDELPATDPNTVYNSSDNLLQNGGGNASDAYRKYVEAYNNYIKLVTDLQNSENLDEDMKEKMRSPEAQRALKAYREAYYEWQKAKSAAGQ